MPQARRAWSRVRQARWAHIITVSGAGLAAVAAIGGLWAQAIATNWTQQTAKDQLNQSREDSRREEQAQASQVTFWVQDAKSGSGQEVHVSNRSFDPVTDVHLRVTRWEIGAYDGPVGFYGLPPCTEEIYDTQAIFFVKWEKNKERREPLIDEYAFTDLTFVDNHGRRWVRSARALTGESDWNLVAPGTEWNAPLGAVDLGEPIVRKADHCGEGHI
ncbi:hypothetical protein ABZX38_21165 [Streptomyces longwoodensis]|uniref:hypothetical protein n=1 Tax=Streptomyces longwoodensis TaxID=68231 RepID=UPI0033B3A236